MIDLLGNAFIFLVLVSIGVLLCIRIPFTSRQKQADILAGRIKATKDEVQAVLAAANQVQCREHAAKMQELRATLTRMNAQERLNERLSAHKAKLSRRNYRHFV